MRFTAPRRVLLALFLCGAACAAAQEAQGRRPIGIPEIDSLPVNDWGTQKKGLSMPLALGLATVVPGGGQFYGGHPVRGSFLAGLETMLVGLSLYTRYVDLPRRDREIRFHQRAADSALADWNRNPGSAQAEAEYRAAVKSSRDNALLRLQYADLANSQLAWGIGLHLYGIADAIEIVNRSNDPVPPERSVGRAFVYGLAFPGGGQLYNGRYGKFGMLWMALGASAVSVASRQHVVEQLNDAVAIARAEREAGLSADVEGLLQDRQIYRRRRNQYYFGMGLFYIYAIMDGMVDAALSDFDRPNRYAIGPGYEPFSIVATYSF